MFSWFQCVGLVWQRNTNLPTISSILEIGKIILYPLINIAKCHHFSRSTIYSEGYEISIRIWRFSVFWWYTCSRARWWILTHIVLVKFIWWVRVARRTAHCENPIYIVIKFRTLRSRFSHNPRCDVNRMQPVHRSETGF